MRLRILTYNIQFFASTKINDAQIRNLIQDIAMPATVGIQADIFIVIEVRTSGGAVGTPIAGSGSRATRQLLGVLQAQDVNWRLVPPMRLTNSTEREGIAVYYRQNKVTFTGPGAYNYAGSGFAGLAGPAANGQAGQCQFYVGGNAANAEVRFSLARNRRPWLCTFTTVPAGVAFKLLAFHAAPVNKKRPPGGAPPPPHNQLPFLGTQQLANIHEITAGAVGVPILVTGDFNCDTFDNQYLPAYAPLIAAGYTRRFHQVETVITTPDSALPNNYLVDHDYDNFLTRNVNVFNNANPNIPNFSVVDPVSADPPNYPEIPDIANNNYTWANIPTNVFRARRNYRTVRRCSDHLPIYFDANI